MEETTLTNNRTFAERSEKIGKLSIKLVEIMQGISAIAKNGRNQQQGYDYTEASDVFSVVREALAKHRVVIFPTTLKKAIENRSNPNGKPIMITAVTMAYTIVDCDSEEYVTVTYEGEGMDSGDKGLPKALSICMKYYLRDQFLIPFGEDVENESGKKETGKKDQPPTVESNGNGNGNGHKEEKPIDEHVKIACSMLKNMGFKEETDQLIALKNILEPETINSLADLTRDHMFKFYQAMENLLGKKVEKGYKRTAQDYSMMRQSYDQALEVK